jgi:hypothetical protein
VAKRSLPAIMLFALLAFCPAAASAMTVYMKSDERIEAESAWRSNGRVFIKIDRDALIDFSEDEVNLARTFDRKNREAASQTKTAKSAAGSSTPKAKEIQTAAGFTGPANRKEASVKTRGLLKDENLLISMADGYKIDFQDRQGNMLMTELVPEGESVHNWTEMITMQIFFGGVPQRNPEAFSEGLVTLWTRSCQGAETQHIRKGTENGYPFAF